MNTRPLYGALLGALPAGALLAPPAAAAQEDFALAETGTGGTVVSCDPSAAAACHRRFTGTATGTGLPYGHDVLDVVVDLRTGGAWDERGCQPLTEGGTVTFHRRLDRPDIGSAEAAERHVPHGRRRRAHASGGRLRRTGLPPRPLPPGDRLRDRDPHGRRRRHPGDTGPWRASEAGVLAY
ncbi:hypothetical protein [Streptomyces sp. NPDC085529]|uniref:hypothetical protein n=1 Tax=Streptomyces sp. NPDC085529 TaxID=3365729 RepID=UPI0037CE85DB